MSAFLASVLGIEVGNTAELRGGTVVLGKFAFLPKELPDSEIYDHFERLGLGICCVALEDHVIAVCGKDESKIEEIAQAVLVLFMKFCVSVALFKSQVSSDALVEELVQRTGKAEEVKQERQTTEMDVIDSDFQFDSSSDERETPKEEDGEVRGKWNEMRSAGWQAPVKRLGIECSEVERALNLFQETVEVVEPTRFQIFTAHVKNRVCGLPEVTPELVTDVASHAPVIDL